MRVWQAGSHLTQRRDTTVDDWSWRRTARRISTLARLTAPYKRQTTLALGSLLAATAVGLAPPYLAKLALDEGIASQDFATLAWIVALFGVAGVAGLRDQLRADVLHRLDRRTDPRRPTEPPLQAPAAPLARLLRAEPRRRDHQPADERRRGARPARDRRRDDARPEHADPDRLVRDPVPARLEARARDARRRPLHACGDGRCSGSSPRARTGPFASGSASSRRRSPRTSRACGSSRRTRASARTSSTSAT